MVPPLHSTRCPLVNPPYLSPGSPCTLTLTSPSLPPSIPLSYPRVDCHTRTPARCHRPFLLQPQPEHRTPTVRCSECNLLSQHSAIIPTSSSSPRTHCTTARSPPGHHLPNLSPPLSAASSLHSPPPNSDKPDTPTPPPPSIPFSYPGVDQKAEPTTPSPAAAHPPVYTNHRSRSLPYPGVNQKPTSRHQQGRDPAPLLSVGDSGSRRASCRLLYAASSWLAQ